MRRLLAWLSKRFPEQRVVSLEDYTKLLQDLYTLQGAFIEVRSQIVQIDAQVKKLNDMNGYVSTVKGSMRLER